MKKTGWLLLTVALLLVCLAGCRKNQTENPDGEENIEAADLQLQSAEASGITSHGWIAESAFPANDALREWYEEAADRENLTNALLYAKGVDGLWHCWLYIGTWQDGDGLEMGRDGNGAIALNHKPQNADAEAGSAGAVYFTLQSEPEPDFDFYINGVSEGILQELSDASVAR